MAWINVTKPTTANWTGVLKPAESSVTSQGFTGGTPIGLLLALTQSSVISSSSSIITGWGAVPDPVGTPWTLVGKPTT